MHEHFPQSQRMLLDEEAAVFRTGKSHKFTSISNIRFLHACPCFVPVAQTAICDAFEKLNGQPEVSCEVSRVEETDGGVATVKTLACKDNSCASTETGSKKADDLHRRQKSSSPPALCYGQSAFSDEGFIVWCELHPHGAKGSMADDCIAAHMYRAVIDKRVECVVVLSGNTLWLASWMLFCLFSRN